MPPNFLQNFLVAAALAILFSAPLQAFPGMKNKEMSYEETASSHNTEQSDRRMSETGESIDDARDPSRLAGFPSIQETERGRLLLLQNKNILTTILFAMINKQC